jgi:hypothetical protein
MQPIAATNLHQTAKVVDSALLTSTREAGARVRLNA